MNPASEAQVQQELVQTPAAQHLLRGRAIRRTTIVLGLVAVVGLFLLLLPLTSRRLFLYNLAANRLLIALLFLFGLDSISLLWSLGQRLDVWLFNALNLRGYHVLWMDRAMWVATQTGNIRFTALLVVAADLVSVDHCHQSLDRARVRSICCAKRGWSAGMSLVCRFQVGTRRNPFLPRYWE